MTKMDQAPSLPQARDPDTVSNNWNLNYNRLSLEQTHNHRHLHSHIRARHHHDAGDSNEKPHIRLPHEQQQSREQQQPRQRDESDLDPLVTKVVSVVQVVDGAGATVDVKTYGLPDPAAAQPDSLTAALSPILDPAAPTAEVPSSDHVLPTATDTDPSATTSPPLSSLSGSEPLTSAPSSTFTSFPSLSGVYNSTSRPSFLNSTSLHSLFSNSTTTARSNSSFTFSIATTTSDSSSSLLSTTTVIPVTVAVGGNADSAGGPGATAAAEPTVTSTSTGAGIPPMDPTTKSIVGGVVGGLAGVAIIAMALLMVLKWKRQRGNGIRLLSEHDDPSRRLSLFARVGGPTSGSGPGGFAIPAAFASLAGGYNPASTYQATIEAAPSTSEKGFYRVGGRKLTSVLQSGGDGYSEPLPESDTHLSPGNENDRSNVRDSNVSGTSFYRPDSIAMFSNPHSPPLQLGSPMRPESGIMIMRSGPARTPVQESGPFFDGEASPPLTPPVFGQERDPLGRSFLSPSTGSGGSSVGRFAEEKGI